MGRSLADVFVSVFPQLDPKARAQVKREVKKIADENEDAGKKSGDKFGHGFSTSVGKATKGAGLLVAGAATGGLVALGATLFEGVKSATSYQTVLKKTAAVIKSTGNQAHISVSGIKNLAANLETISGVDEELIINSQNVLGTFTNIKNVGKDKIFDQATKSALDMSVALGTDLQGSSIQVGKALNDPIKGITALSRVGVSFTQQQKDQIKALVKSGDTMGAQKLILKELNTEFGGAAKAAGSGFQGALDRAKDAMSDAGREAGTALLPILTKAADIFAKDLPKAVEFTKRALKRIKAGIDEFRQGFSGDLGDSALARFGAVARKAFDAVREAIRAAVPVITGIARTVRAVVSKVAAAFQGGGHGELGGVVAQLKVNFGLIVDIVRDAMRLIQIVVTRVVKFIASVWRRYGDIITKTVIGVFGGLYKILGGALKIIRGILDVAIGLLTGDWSRAWHGLTSIAGGALDIIKGALRVAWALIRGIFQSGIRYLHGLWSGFWADATKRFKGAFHDIIDTAQTMWRVLKGIFRIIVLSWLDSAGAIVHAAAKAFSWVPGVGPKLRRASAEFDKFRDRVNRSFGGIHDPDISIDARFHNHLPRVLYGVRVGGGAGSSRGGITSTLATGGPVNGPGTGTSDSIPAMLSNGEHVWTAAEVRAAGGHGAVEGMRQAVVSGVRRAAGGAIGRLSIGGGYLDVAPKLDRALQRAANAMAAASARAVARTLGGFGFNASLNGGLNFAKAQAGKPYIWGGVGPRGYDCSGFMSAILNVVQGRNPYARRFSTASFPSAGFVPGPGAFSIGYFRGSPGHMAGTINGVNVESSGSIGAHYGRSARGARDRMFTGGIYHLRGYARGGPVLSSDQYGDAPYDLLAPGGNNYSSAMRRALLNFGTGRHMAMAGGGVIGEPVLGYGLRSGGSYSFGERGPETVRPGIGSAAGNTYNINVNVPMASRAADVGREVVTAITAYEQRNGKGWRR